MSKRPAVAIVLTVVLGSFAIGIAPTFTAAQDKTPVRVKWEYKIVRVPSTAPGPGGVIFPMPGGVVPTGPVPGVISEATLTALGEQGWELDKITGGLPYIHSFRVDTPPIAPPGIGPNTINTIHYSETVYYFKRVK
jgi:hypothetical protein